MAASPQPILPQSPSVAPLPIAGAGVAIAKPKRKFTVGLGVDDNLAILDYVAELCEQDPISKKITDKELDDLTYAWGESGVGYQTDSPYIFLILWNLKKVGPMILFNWSKFSANIKKKFGGIFGGLKSGFGNLFGRGKQPPATGGSAAGNPAPSARPGQ